MRHISCLASILQDAVIKPALSAALCLSGCGSVLWFLSLRCHCFATLIKERAAIRSGSALTSVSRARPPLTALALSTRDDAAFDRKRRRKEAETVDYCNSRSLLSFHCLTSPALRGQRQEMHLGWVITVHTHTIIMDWLNEYLVWQASLFTISLAFFQVFGIEKLLAGQELSAYARGWWKPNLEQKKQNELY